MPDMRDAFNGGWASKLLLVLGWIGVACLVFGFLMRPDDAVTCNGEKMSRGDKCTHVSRNHSSYTNSYEEEAAANDRAGSVAPLSMYLGGGLLGGAILIRIGASIALKRTEPQHPRQDQRQHTP